MYYGGEFTSLAMLRWAADHGIALQFIDPGKPIQNAHIESFNGRARDEFFNVHAFRTLAEARSSAIEWQQEYNEIRPHSSLGNRTPQEFEDELLNRMAPQIQVA
jgi:putative transposase